MRSICLLLMRKKSLLRDVACVLRARMPHFLLSGFSQFPVIRCGAGGSVMKNSLSRACLTGDGENRHPNGGKRGVHRSCDRDVRCRDAIAH